MNSGSNTQSVVNKPAKWRETAAGLHNHFHAARVLTAVVVIFASIVGPSNPSAAGPFEDGVSAYQRGDYVAAMGIFRTLAEGGNGDAQYNLGIMFDKGTGVRPDAKTAAEWYRRAANAGVVDAQCSLGIVLAEGRGVPKNSTAAVEWFRKAANQGDARCQWSLGSMYLNGTGVAQDYSEAMNWNRKAAEQGLAEAQQNVGMLYFNGLGTRMDKIEAVKWYRLAAQKGLASVQFLLGYGLATGEGMDPNPTEAEQWLRKAAEQNYPNAQTALDAVTKVLGTRSTNLSAASPNPSVRAAAGTGARGSDGSRDGRSPTLRDDDAKGARLTGADLSRIVGTYRENEMRFKRDFQGRRFADILPFYKTTEKLFSKDEYTVSFGTGRVAGEIDCTVASASGIAEIANWNRGDKVRIEGIVRDVTIGSVQLESCTLSK